MSPPVQTTEPYPATGGPDFDAALRSQRVDRLEQLVSVHRLLDEVRTAKSDGTADDEHDPDGPTLSMEWSQLMGLREQLLREASEIDRALQRVQQLTFGLCVRCGTAIGPARLAARPATEHCIDCARAREAREH